MLILWSELGLLGLLILLCLVLLNLLIPPQAQAQSHLQSRLQSHLRQSLQFDPIGASSSRVRLLWLVLPSNFWLCVSLLLAVCRYFLSLSSRSRRCLFAANLWLGQSNRLCYLGLIPPVISRPTRCSCRPITFSTRGHYF